MRRLALPALVLGAMLAALYVPAALFLPGRLGGREVEVRIERGMGFRSITRTLEGEGLLHDKWFFTLLARLSGLDTRVRPGYYAFAPGASPWDVYRALSEGRIVEIGLQVPEGETMRDIAMRVQDAGLGSADEFLRLCRDPALLGRLGVHARSAEGYLFPDTYRFYKGASIEEMIEVMVGRLFELYDAGLRDRGAAMGLEVREALTLASIIEKETRVPQERPLVAAVYHNRLRIGMPLQADPTAIYGLKPQRDGVTARDIRARSEYNTYFIRGLPPGPIASPGIDSIRAALYPAEVPYLYFVADGTGAHVFSRTSAEHERAVRRYREACQAAGQRSGQKKQIKTQ